MRQPERRSYVPVEIGGPDQMPTTPMCIVNINNTDHTFKVAPPSPTCATPGTAITSFTAASGPSGSPWWWCDYAQPGGLPASMNPATSRRCNETFGVRLQSPTFPLSNPAISCGARAAYTPSRLPDLVRSHPMRRKPIRLRRGVMLTSSNASFDWDKNVVVP